MNLYEATEQAREALAAAGIRPTNPKIIAVAHKLVTQPQGRAWPTANDWVKRLMWSGRI